MTDCTHTTEEQYWEDDLLDDDGEVLEYGEWKSIMVPTTTDLDLHRYQCTQCKKIMYYSGAARKFYEEGITCNVTGLDNALL